MTRLRRLAFVLRLVRSRLARRSGGSLLVALGVAAGAAALAAVLGGGLVARDRAAARAVRSLPAANRALRVTWLGIPGQASEHWSALDRRARRAAEGAGGSSPFAVILYRETRFEQRLLDLGGVERVGRWVKLTTGRLPSACTPARCEVVELGGSGPIPRVPGLRVVVVGRGALRSEVPFGSFILPGSYGRQRAQAIGYHAPPAPPLLLAEGARELARLPALDSIYRSYAWVAPIRAGTLPPWRLDAFAAAVAHARADLQAASPLYDLTAPVEELQGSARESEAGARRLLLIGGQAAALLLAFALLTGSSLRDDLEAARRRLTWLGARRAQLALQTVAEAGSIALVGTVAGWLLGVGAAAAVADAAGSPAGAILRHSVLSSSGLALAGAVLVATTVLTLLAVAVRPARVGGLAIGPLEIGAVGALVAVVVGFVRGGAGPDELAAGRGTGILLALVPGLAAYVAAVVCARGLAPLLRGAARLVRGRGVPVRLAVLSLARHPGRSALAVAFLVVSVGLALFAATYHSTLSRNEADEAAYSVPADFVVSEDFSKLVYPLEAASIERFDRLAPRVRAFPVIRVPADVQAATAASATLLGVPAAALPTLRGWRRDFSSRSPSELARLIAAAHPPVLRGLALPRGARSVAVRARTRGDAVRVFAEVATEDGGFAELRLGDAAPNVSRVLRARLPPDARGGVLVGLRLGVAGHGNADAVEQVSTGELRLGPLRASVDGSGDPPATHYHGWIGINGIHPRVGADGAALRYVVSNEVFSRFRPRQETDGHPVPVAVTPALAAAAGAGGLLPIDLSGQQLLTRVVATVRRVPSVEGDVVLADQAWLSTALNADTPGSGPVQEIWLQAPRRVRPLLGAALARPPFDALARSSQAAVERSLRREPLARGSLLTLAAAAFVALALAVFGLLLAVISDVRDERGELLDLETQGASPATLRRHLRLRALLITVVGAAGGIALSVALSVLVVDLVALTANARLPQPPLALYADWSTVGLGALAFVLATAAVVGAATWLPFREQRPA